MKTTLVLLLACASLLAETKTEAELRKQLEATQAALSAERERSTKLSVGTQKLTETVAATAEKSEKNTAKIDAAVERIEQSEASGKKLAETVKTQAAASVTETKKLTEVVTESKRAVTSAIAAQIAQQEKGLIAAREVARKLEESNKVLARTNEENRIAKEKNAKSLEDLKATLEDIQHKAAIAAALDKAAARHDWIKLIGDIATPLCGVLLALVVVFQIKASAQAKATHVMVNGVSERKDNRIRELENQIRGGSLNEEG